MNYQTRIRMICFSLVMMTLSAPHAVAKTTLPKLHLIVVADNPRTLGFQEAVEQEASNALANYCIPESLQDTCLSRIVLHTHPLGEHFIVNPETPVTTRRIDSFLEVIAHIDDMPINRNRDAIVVHYIGHGSTENNPARSEIDSACWDMRIDKQGEFVKGQILYISTLRTCLEKKNARLCVMLNDCCSTKKTAKEGMQPCAPYPDRIPPAVLSLFFHSKGIVDLRACKPGEAATTYSQRMGLGGDDEFSDQYGTVFSTVYSTLLFEKCDHHYTWKSFYTELSRSSDEFIRINDLYERKRERGGDVRVQIGQHPNLVSNAQALTDQELYQLSDYGLGVYVAPVRRGGVRITQIIRDSDAMKEGLQVGDVIQSIDHRRVSNRNELATAIRAQAIAGAFTVHLTRNGEPMTFDIVTYGEAFPGDAF